MQLVEGFVAGSIGRIVSMHGEYYEREWEMGQLFEAMVAEKLGSFAQRYDPHTDLVLLGIEKGRVDASMIVDLNDPRSGDRGGHLRFFMLDDGARGTGIGKLMMQRAMDHVDDKCDGKCWLTTFGGLDAARHLYEKHGFQLTDEVVGKRWGFELTDQVFERPKKPV